MIPEGPSPFQLQTIGSCTTVDGIEGASAGVEERIIPGNRTEEELDRLIIEGSRIPVPGERIVFLSGHFLGTPYEESTLVGDPDTPEIMVVNLAAMDCFTFLDYVEAMRRSDSYASFRENLPLVRYRGGQVDYGSRNHFFTDWLFFNLPWLEEATSSLGGEVAEVRKNLNDRGDGTRYLPAIPVTDRTIAYLPTGNITDRVRASLQPGDYVGIYSSAGGLDVSHVGITVVRKGKAYLRHASSRAGCRQVVDEPLKEYLEGKPGIVVLRPR